jgi:tripartite-type tricarboxylate transporter receptor subunit TctC
VAKLSTEIIEIVTTQEVQYRLRSLGLTPTVMPGSTLTADVATDSAFWSKLTRDRGVKVA